VIPMGKACKNTYLMVRQDFCAKGTKSLLEITKTYMRILNIKEFRV
jgi:hypothetical protein